MGRAGALVAVLVTLLSCNAVKEKRQDCPCILSVQMKELPAYPAVLFVNGSPAGTAQRDSVLSLWVDGGLAALAAVAGALPSDKLEIRIPYGLQAPPLYAWRDTVDCTGETALARVHLRKQYCALDIRIKGILAPGGSVSPRMLSVAVRGSVNGYSLADGQPLEGAFRCLLPGSGVCRLPRQRAGDPLWLDIVLEDRVLRSFPLGTYLESAGYDWYAPDLEDRTLEVDISLTRIRFQCALWSITQELEIVI